MVKSRKNLIVLFAALAGIVGTTFLSQLVKYIDWPLGRTVAKAVFYLLLGLIAWGAMKIVGMPVRIHFRKGRSYGIGLILALSLSAVIAVLPALCGFSLVGGPAPFSWSGILYDLFFFLLFVGPVEEFVFRVWLQEALTCLFPRRPWMGVVAAAFLFGLWHMINGSILQVLFAFGIGLVFGFAKYTIRDCGYVGVAFGHGLYDFLNTLVRMLIV